MRPEFARLMTHTLTIHRRERDWQGAFQTVLTTPGVRGFVEYGKRKVVNRKGEEVTAAAIVYLRNDAPVDAEHPHWLIDQTAPHIRQNLDVIDIYPIDDPRTGNTHHYEAAVK